MAPQGLRQRTSAGAPHLSPPQRWEGEDASHIRRVSALPWFPLWVADFQQSRHVRLMPLEAVGLYTLMLCAQWDGGDLPDDPEAVARIIGRDVAEVEAAWPYVRPCFELNGTGIVNPRLETERRRQATKRARLSAAGKRGAKLRWSQNP